MNNTITTSPVTITTIPDSELGRLLQAAIQRASQVDTQLAAATQENAALTREVAGLRYYIQQLERNVSQEERAYAAGIASLMLSQYDIDNPNWAPAADLQARDGQRVNDPREQARE